MIIQRTVTNLMEYYYAMKYRNEMHLNNNHTTITELPTLIFYNKIKKL